MSTTAIAATEAYRNQVALAAANGTAISRIAFIALGEGADPYSIDQTALAAEFARLNATVNTQGVVVVAAATVDGTTVGSRVLREVGAFTANGTMVGRRVIAPKEFDNDTQMDFELHFQF